MYDGQADVLTVFAAMLFLLALLACWNLFKRLVSW